MITISNLQVDKQSVLSKAVIQEDINAIPESSYVLSEARDDGVSDDGRLIGPYRVYNANSYRLPFVAQRGKLINLNDANPRTKQILVSGFSSAESWGVWSDGYQAHIKFLLDEAPLQPVLVTIVARAWINSGHERFTAVAYVGDKQVSVHEFTDPRPFDWKIYVASEDVPVSKEILIKLKFDNLTSPLKTGESLDPRNLGIGIVGLKVDW
jgi:hypothetical protein